MISSIIVFLVVAGLVYYCITLLPLPAPFPMIIRVVFILLAILWLVNFLPNKF